MPSRHKTFRFCGDTHTLYAMGAKHEHYCLHRIRFFVAVAVCRSRFSCWFSLFSFFQFFLPSTMATSKMTIPMSQPHWYVLLYCLNAKLTILIKRKKIQWNTDSKKLSTMAWYFKIKVQLVLEQLETWNFSWTPKYYSLVHRASIGICSWPISAMASA